jgi:prepilin-type N-terminal cleavage/methylation domain-containing protein
MPNHTLRPESPREAGFTLIEAIVAMVVLTIGLLGLAQVFYLGMMHVSTSSSNLIAREKAREAVESVHTARDTQTLTWAQVRNVSAGGVFVDGAVNMGLPGPDGLINTADDVGVETLREPGPDGVLGNTDDIQTPLNTFRRRVQILDLAPVNPDLREIRVTITYNVGPAQRTYVLRTFISSFS